VITLKDRKVSYWFDYLIRCALLLHWKLGRQTASGTARRVLGSPAGCPQGDRLPTPALMAVSPVLRSNGEVAELNMVSIDAGVLNQFKSKLVEDIP
jgi:hypothetical protein